MNVSYAGIAHADASRLAMKLRYGAAAIDWTKLTPQTLPAVLTVAPPNAPDAADRQWRCAVFAAETGQSAKAQKLGEAAAAAKPAYRERVPALSLQ